MGHWRVFLGNHYLGNHYLGNHYFTKFSLSALVMNLALLLVALLGASGASAGDDWQRLTVDRALGDWGEKRGEWVAVGAVASAAANPKALTHQPGEGVLWNGPKGRTVNLFTAASHGDLEFQGEFLVPQGSNSGIYFQGRYEIQVLDSWGVAKPTYSDCGGIYQRWENERGFEGHAPRVNASKAPGEWQTFHVIFRAPRFDAARKKIAPARFVKVVHNDKLIHENVDVNGPTRAAAYQDEASVGPIMLQGDHGPVAFRNLRWRPLRQTP